MDLLIIMTYAAFAYGCFKLFNIPVNKWTVPTAILGGIVIVAGLILTMNYNHPYTFMAQKAVITVPVIPQVSGTVSEVPVIPNQEVKAGTVLFKIDPTVYQARVDRLKADLVKAEQQVESQQAQLDATQSEVQRATAERDKARKDLARYQKASGKAVNPFTEQEATNAKQTYLAQEAKLATAAPNKNRFKASWMPLSMAKMPPWSACAPNCVRPNTTWGKPK